MRRGREAQDNHTIPGILAENTWGEEGSRAEQSQPISARNEKMPLYHNDQFLGPRNMEQDLQF